MGHSRVDTDSFHRSLDSRLAAWLDATAAWLDSALPDTLLWEGDQA